MSKVKDLLLDAWSEPSPFDPEIEIGVFPMSTVSTSTVATASSKVEDLVKKAIMETLRERKETEGASPSAADETYKAIEEVVKPKKSKHSLSTGTVWCSDLLKIEKTEDDFPVRVFLESSWDDKVKFLIPQVNKDYVIQTKEAKDILRAWEIDDKSLVYGPTGSGKSSMIEQLCAMTNRPFLRINATGDMDSSQIFGQLTAKEGSTVWEDGSVTEAVRYGAVLGWDEWEVTPPEIAMGLQWLLEDNSKLFLKEMPGTAGDKFIKPHDAFRIVCMGNTQGQGDESGHHAGVNVQNTATIDRFGTVVYLQYLDPDHEENIILKKYAIKKSVAKMMVKVANLIRQGYTQGQLSLTMSPRTLLGIAKKMDHGVAFGEALRMQYVNKLSDTQQRVAKELIGKVTGLKEF